MNLWHKANWLAPDWLYAGTTTRIGGISKAPYNQFNLALHVNDSESDVIANRQQLVSKLNLPSEPVWLNQIHGNKIIEATHTLSLPKCDGSYCFENGMVVAVITADCLPLLLCDIDRHLVAAIHVGWRGLCNGIVENALNIFSSPSTTIAWLGPCISKNAYEVNKIVREACLQVNADYERFFTPNREDHWLMDIKGIVATSLDQYGINAVYDSGCCTYSDSNLWYSYRRDGVTGRMASLIWMNY